MLEGRKARETMSIRLDSHKNEGLKRAEGPALDSQEIGRLKGRKGPWDNVPAPRQSQDWRAEKAEGPSDRVPAPLNSTVIKA